MSEKINKQQFRSIFVSSTGGLLEMYDFVIYAFFAPIIAKLFFPNTDAFVSYLATFAIFAVGYLARPVGAIIFGFVADRYGRKKSFLWTIILMASGTALIGTLPTWQQIGDWAPVLLLLLRILQGIAVSGDLPAAITFVAEHADATSRGRSTAWIYLGVNVGLLLALLVSTLLVSIFTSQQIISYGWRVAFLSGLVIGVIGLYLRLKLVEPAIFVKLMQQTTGRGHLLRAYQQHAGLVIKGILATMIFAVIVGLMLYLPTYFQHALHFTHRHAIQVSVLVTLLFSLLIPVFGRLSDKLGRKTVIIAANIGFMLFAYPIYFVLNHGAPWEFYLAIVMLSALCAAPVGSFPALLAELFPTNIRCSGVGLTYNMSFALFCGTTPFIMTYLIHATGNALAPSFYLMFAGLLSSILLLTLKETAAKPLDLEGSLPLPE